MNIEYGYCEPASVHFDDLDAMGMVHNARYALLVEQAYVGFWTRQGFGYSGPESPGDAFAVVGEFQISYQVPISRIGEVMVHMWTERIGNSSSTTGFRVISLDGQTVHATGHRVHIKIDPRTRRPAPWSAEVREVATRFASPTAVISA